MPAYTQGYQVLRENTVPSFPNKRAKERWAGTDSGSSVCTAQLWHPLCASLVGIAQVGAAVSVQLTPEKETPELRNSCYHEVCTDGCMHLNTLCCAAIAWALSVHLCVCMAAYL